MRKLAVLEMDIRACKMMILEYCDKEHVNVVEECSEPLEIWRDIEEDNIIKPIRTQEVMNILKSYKQLMEIHGVAEVVGYSTQVLKTVKNHRSFIEELHNTLGIRFDVLSDDELSKCIHLCNAYTMEHLKSIVVFIENEVVHFLKYNRRNIIEHTSFDFGPYTLGKIFEEKIKNLTPEERMEKLVKFATEQFEKVAYDPQVEESFKVIGMGSAFKIAGKLCRTGKRMALSLEHNFELDAASFDQVYNFVKGLDVTKAQKIKGLGDERADAILTGTAIIKALFNRFNYPCIYINSCGLISGKAYAEINNIFGDRPIGDILTRSLEACNYFYDREEFNALDVCETACELFDELRILHRFSKPQLKILKIAAYFANCGRRVNYYNFEKISFNIVLNSKIYGASQKEILLAAFVCATQNLEDFDFALWAKYKDILKEDDIEIVKKLGVIVRLARLISKGKACDHIDCDILGDKCILNVVPKYNKTCHLIEVKKCATDFAKVFGKQLQVL